jgi:ubiquinone/menaquinone biosynthesis C-methylase UbiE/lipoprotein NlpI
MELKSNLDIKNALIEAFQSHKKNNFKNAEIIYQKILRKNPKHFETIFYLGTLYSQLEKYDLAEPLFEKAISINPNFEVTYQNLGFMYEQLRKYKKAKSCYEKLIQLNPKNIKIYNNLGLIYQELGEYEKAINCYEKLIQTNPNDITLYYNLGRIFKLFKLDDMIKNNHSNLKKLFLCLFRKNDISHSEIFHNTKLFFLKKNIIDNIEQIYNSDSLLLSNKIINNLLIDELFLLTLQKSLFIDEFLEKFLTKIRYETILSLKNSNQNFLRQYLNFFISLGEQCWLNEYVYNQSELETIYANELKSKIENENGVDELKISILSCYIPLNSSKIIEKKLINHNTSNPLFKGLISTQIKEPLVEKSLESSIKSIGKITNQISKKVREQYEENPYPRWKYCFKYSSINFIEDLNYAIKPNKIESKNQFTNPDILIAACGTGNHTIYASKYKNAKIVGIDLSLKSLTYAKRKIKELGFKNIEFFHSDILQLKNLNKKFDVIESIGTLHHMKEPENGLKILVDILKPHGFLKLGLYSEKARDYVIKAREIIKEMNIKTSIEDIRRSREIFFNKKNDVIIQKLIGRGDFYSTSNVRDLLFHVQEHRFTIPQISKMLKKFNLEFLGFINTSNKNKFLKSFPQSDITSLKSWDKFEKENPSSFIGMYQFWVKKI